MDRVEVLQGYANSAALMSEKINFDDKESSDAESSESSVVCSYKSKVFYNIFFNKEYIR